jgi:hypothetical protein
MNILVFFEHGSALSATGRLQQAGNTKTNFIVVQ